MGILIIMVFYFDGAGGFLNTLMSLKVFCKVVQLGSFTQAANELGISVAMASKHLRHLEHEIGAKLLQRNSRNIHLTQIGDEYHKQALFALETLENAAKKAGSGRLSATGTLRVSMPSWFANAKVMSWLEQYQVLYPEVSLDISATNRKVDLVAEGFDLALRATNELRPALISRPLTKIEFYLVASEAYLKQFGQPSSPTDINHHRFIYSNYNKEDILQLLHRQTQQSHQIKIDPYIQSDDTMMSYQLACSGFGICHLPSWLVEEKLQSGELVRLLESYEILTVNLQAVYTDRTFLSAKVRTFIDFLVQKCQT